MPRSETDLLVGEFTYPGQAPVSSLGHHVRGAEGDTAAGARRMATEQKDPLRAGPVRGQHGTQPYRAVTDHGYGGTLSHPASACRVHPRRHHVGQRQHGGQSFVVRTEPESD
ncbi:hypothetical protein [Streptomyces niveus]|uniref:Uncharacterized protein n=1 Tax=Streptomyces niveus TaxID=193462 RepID=A0ABZ2AJ84_STRNV|nr:hypothetical protein [Streptomyces niveus]